MLSQQSPRRTNNLRELPRASAASLFNSGMNTPLSQFNNVQFDSFTNEVPTQHNGAYGSSMSLPPMQTGAPPPNFAQHSGPPSLEGSSAGNPYRAKGRGSGRHGRQQYKPASSLFNPTGTPEITSNNTTSASMPMFNTPPPNTFQQQQSGVDTSFNSFSTMPNANSMNQAPNVMGISQPPGFDQYPHIDISEEKRRKAEEENDRLRAEKHAKRAENMEKFSQQREMRIAQQEKEKETLNVLNSFQNDPSPLNLAAKPRSKEERRNIRDRAKKAREKRSHGGHDAGDLGSLINEISSRGNSICSDIPSEQSLNDSGHFAHNSMNNSNLLQSSSTNPPETNTLYQPSMQQQNLPPTNSNVTDAFNPSHTTPNANFGNASHLFGIDNASNVTYQPPPLQEATDASSDDFFNSQQSHTPNTASQMFSPHQNQIDQTAAATNSTSFFDSQNTQAPPRNTAENKQSDNIGFYQSLQPQLPQQQHHQHREPQSQQSFPDTVSYYDQPEGGNIQTQQTLQSDTLQTFVPQDHFNQSFVPMQDNTMVPPHGYKQQQQPQHNLSMVNTENTVQQPHNETPLNVGQQINMVASNGQYITDSNGQQYYQQTQDELLVNTDNNLSAENGNNAQDELQSGGSSGSSSYAMVSSTKSMESESRLSPYQFLESTQYPAQSSFNSNESSPLDVQNMSTASTYEKVSAPSMSMSSFDITSASSTEIQPNTLQLSTNVVEEIEEAAEAFVEPPLPVEQPACNVVLENKKLLQQKAAALFEEAKQINQRGSTSSSGPHSMENQASNFSSPNSPVQLPQDDRSVPVVSSLFPDTTQQQQQQQQQMQQTEQTDVISTQPNHTDNVTTSMADNSRHEQFMVPPNSDQALNEVTQQTANSFAQQPITTPQPTASVAEPLPSVSQATVITNQPPLYQPDFTTQNMQQQFTQPPQPMPQPLQPVARPPVPSQPITQPSQPVAQLPVQLPQSVVQALQPVVPPPQPVIQPSQPMTQSLQHVAQPPQSMAQHVAQPLQPVTQAEQQVSSGIPHMPPQQIPQSQQLVPQTQHIEPKKTPDQDVISELFGGPRKPQQVLPAQQQQQQQQQQQPLQLTQPPVTQPLEQIVQLPPSVAEQLPIVTQPLQQTTQPLQQAVQSPQPVVEPLQQVVQPPQLPQPVVQLPQQVGQLAQPAVQQQQPMLQQISQLPNTPTYPPQQPTTPQTSGLPHQAPMQMMATQQMYSQPTVSTLTAEQAQQYTQYYQQMGYTPEQISQILAQQYGYSGGMSQGYGDMYSSMWLQQQQYMQQMQEMQAAYYYGYYGYPYSSYPSSVASSYNGDSRPGSVIERPSSITSDQVLSELGDLTSELSFQNRTASPSVEEVMQRTTPLSFTRPHIGAAFSMTGGVLNIVAPKQPLDGEVATVQNIMVESIVGIPLLKRFPGPLLRGDTNKKQIANFIVETIQIYLPRMYSNDNNQLVAHTALWEFVGLLLKQNGTFDGSDVADMLIGLLPSVEVKNGREMKGFSVLCNSVVSPHEDAMEELQMLMATGRVKDGLDHAIQTRLWGHAFMLGSLMGPKFLGMVQTKFSASMKKSDPMKTLYTHLSNKDAILIKKRVNVDTWVQNLCMLVSQRTMKPDHDRQKILCFGDALRDLGLVAAAHLCYLIANVTFGCHNNGDSRIVLLGLEHRPYVDKSANVWADPVNIQLTEIYQYAKTLHEKTFSIPNFQQYKYEYAMKLVDYGYIPQSMAYLESIGEAIASDSSSRLFSRELCKNIARHANRMVIQEAEKYEDLEIPEWINSVEIYASRAQNHLTSSITKVNLTQCQPTTIISRESLQRSSSSEIPLSPIPHDYTDTSRSNDSSKDINATYESVEPTNPIGSSAPQPYFVPAQNNDNQNQQNWNQQQQMQEDGYDRVDGSNAQQSYDSKENFNNDQMNYDDGSSYPGESPRFDPNHYGNTEENGSYNNEGEQYNEQQQQTETVSTFTPYYPSYDNEEESNQQNDLSSPPMFYNTPQNTFTTPYNDTQFNDTQFNQSNQQPTQPAYEEDEIEEEDLFGGFSKTKSKGSETAKNDVKATGASKGKKESATPTKKDGEQSKGWFGGFLSRFKREKDVHLPDDTNKSIVYDEKLKRWVDKTAGPEDEVAPPPPPPTGGFGMPMKSPPSNATPHAGTSSSINAPLNTPPSMGMMAPPSVGMTLPSHPGQPRRTGSTLSTMSNTSNVSSNASIASPLSNAPVNTPPSVGMTIPNRPGQPRRTASTLSAMSNASNVSNASHTEDLLPQSEPRIEPTVLEEPPAQSISNRGRASRHKQSKAVTPKKNENEEDKKPAGPPSMFSLKAQGGRRGAARYASAAGSSVMKNSPMAPVLDPFASPMNAGEKKAGNNAPVSFFNPGAIQPDPSR